MTSSYPYQLRLPLAPYRFVWRDDAAIDAEKDATGAYTQERYTHADGTSTIIREYRADGSYHIMSDRGEIELMVVSKPGHESPKRLTDVRQRPTTNDQRLLQILSQYQLQLLFCRRRNLGRIGQNGIRQRPSALAGARLRHR